MNIFKFGAVRRLKADPKRILTVITVFCMLSVLFIYRGQAANVSIKEETNPDDLVFTEIHVDPGRAINYTWYNFDSSHSKEVQPDGSVVYNTRDNAWAIWYAGDDCVFWGKRYSFNYGTQATMTIEATVTYADFQHFNGEAGIMLRTSLNDTATNIYFHLREDVILALWRTMDGANTIGSGGSPISRSKTDIPTRLRMVLSRTNVVCSYLPPGSSRWLTCYSGPFNHNGVVYAGMSASCNSGNQNKYQVSTFKDFYVDIQAPSGTEYVEPGEDPGSNPEPDDEIYKLPDDPIIPGLEEGGAGVTDYLMRETFTSGNLFILPKAGAEPSWAKRNWLKPIEDPVWRTDCFFLNELVKLNDDKTNRYLDIDFDKFYMTTGNQNWTDYSVDFDVNFSDIMNTGSDAIPTFGVILRYTDIAQYGYKNYALAFHGGRGTVALSIIYGNNEVVRVPGQAYYTALKTANFGLFDVEGKYEQGDVIPDGKEVGDDKYKYLGKTLHMRVEAFDNTITAYLDNVKIFDYTDLSEEKVLGKGGIGFYSQEMGFKLDNIVVRKLTDYMGGDYDNTIGGRWDQPIPGLIDDANKSGYYTIR